LTYRENGSVKASTPDPFVDADNIAPASPSGRTFVAPGNTHTGVATAALGRETDEGRRTLISTGSRLCCCRSKLVLLSNLGRIDCHFSTTQTT
jgi:hypothetical protein